MKKNLRLLFSLLIIIGIFTITDQTSASATKEKIYPEYVLPKEVSKFPVKLTNGLTITTTKVKGKTVPIIKKGSKTIWQGTALATNSKIRFTVSKNQDTFFYYSQTVEGKSGIIDLIGVNKAGKIFFKDSITNDKRLRVDFLSATIVEVGTEIDNLIFGEAGFASIFYQLYKNGTVEKLKYFDQAFVNSLKKGQLKWTPGAIGTTYKNLYAKANYLDGKKYELNAVVYETWKANYSFYGINHKLSSKVDIINYRHIIADIPTVKSALRSYLGSPVYPEVSYDNSEIFEAGKYYVQIHYSSVFNDLVTISLIPKSMFYSYFYAG